MHCHSTPPMPGRRPPVYQIPNPLDEMPSWNDIDLPDADPEMPEPPEHGPVLPVILH